MANHSALILGVGGLGSVVMVGLLRLGVKTIYIVDYDVVEEHNLNRQLMFAQKDIGRPKVECAKKNAEFHRIGKTEVIGFHGNALTSWSRIIEMAMKSDSVFNCIDYGDSFDIAVQSLCLKLEKPLIMGGTYATSFTVDYFTNKGKACFLCTND